MSGVPCEHDEFREYTKIRPCKVSRSCTFNRVLAVRFFIQLHICWLGNDYTSSSSTHTGIALFDRIMVSTTWSAVSSVRMSMRLICLVISFPNCISSQIASASKSRRRRGRVSIRTTMKLPDSKLSMSTGYTSGRRDVGGVKVLFGTRRLGEEALPTGSDEAGLMEWGNLIVA